MAAAKVAAEAKPAEATEKPRKRKRGLVVIIAAVVLVAGLAGGAWFMLPRFLGARAAPAAKKPEPMRATVPLGAVVVNVPGEGRHYLRVAVSVGVPTIKEVKEVDESKPQLLDLLISTLS